jgi:LuxR family maltose regulon positive regulatory protein
VTTGLTEVVLSSKLFMPRPRVDLVGRERLFGRLREGLAARVTLVEGPAGSGKSTAVAQWLRHDRVAAGWVSLDPDDDDPKRFWRYVLLAVAEGTRDRATPLGREALRRLEAAGSEVSRDVVPTFVNEVTAAGTEVTLVLDDYHLVTAAQVHRSLTLLVEHAPVGLHLVFVARSAPPLPLARLRVQGDLVELGPQDLRFTIGEGTELFNDRLRLGLAAADVERLVAQTEGWAAGLQLAALRLRERGDPAELMSGFSGIDRHVVDYLAEEVLATQSAEVRDFLLRTSILERMCGPLCDALTGRRDGARLIDDIHRANLFVVPLDDERRWFRYHHLFAQLLRNELARGEPEESRALHGRAATWFAAAGDTAAAVSHALEAGDHAFAGELVAAGWRRSFNAGQLDTVRAWLHALPGDLVAGHAGLSIARVWVALDSGRLDEAGAALDATEAAARDSAHRPHGHLLALRALHTYKLGDVSGAARWLEALELSEGDPFVATVHRLLSGLCALWTGDFDRAQVLLGDADRRAREDRNQLAHVYARGCLALLAAFRADPGAEDLVDDARDLVARTVSDEHFVSTFSELAGARVAWRAGRTATAAHAAAAAVELARRGAGRGELAAALLTAAATARDTGPAGETGAAAFLAQARAVLRECADAGPLVGSWLAAEQRIPAPRGGRSDVPEALTERELDILRLLPGPLSQRELASALFVTPNTLKTHVRAIYRKLGAESRGDAVVRARTYGLI